jgi:hypothetical protein
MNAGKARTAARRWVEERKDAWPGLWAAHLAGGIVTMADDEPFPAHKDVDIVLIVDPESPALRSMGPIMPMVEEPFEGLAIEAGFKSADDYASPEAVLANPEIAHHLTVESALYDPAELLAGLIPEVRRRYPERKWVEARVNYERDGFEAALAMRPMAAQMLGATGEANLLGYAHTFLVAAICVANLAPPRIGGSSLVRLREYLGHRGRLDLYEELLGILGVGRWTPEMSANVVEAGADLFDIAVAHRRSPHPFQHKFHAHLRPYFVETCREMLEAGDHREAANWAVPYVCSATDMILVDGPEDERARAAAARDDLLEDLDMESEEQRDQRFESMAGYGEAFFWLIGEIARDNRAVVNP